MSEPNTYAIINNPLLQDPVIAATAARAIQQTLATLGTYTPTEVNTFLDWAYDAGDVVTVEKDGETYRLPIFTNYLNWNGAHDIQWASSGNETRELPNVQERRAYGQGAGIAAIQQVVGDDIYEFETFIEQTNEFIHLIATETDVQAAQEVGRSLFSITAEQIAAVVAQTGVNSTLERFDPDNDYAIGDQVAYNGVWYEFTAPHTAGDPWDPTKVKQIKTMQAIVTEAAGEVASYVEKTGIDHLGQDETLWSLIRQQAERIDLVVSGSGSEASIRIGQIVNGINSSGVLISADKISLNGSTSITGDVTIDGTTYHGLHVSGIETGGLIATDLDVTHKFTMDDGTTCIFYNKPTLDGGATIGDTLTLLGDNGTYSLTPADFPNVIKDASVTGNVLTLTKLNGEQISINFSGATLVSGAWSGNRYIVTATSGTVVATGIVYNHLVPTGSVRKSDKMVYRDVIVYSDDGNGEAADVLFTDSVGINASDVFDDGVRAVSLVKGLWDGGRLVVSPSVGLATPVTVQLSQGQGEWIDEYGTKRYAFPIMDGQGSTGYTCKVNTPTLSSVTAGNSPQRTGDAWFDTMTVTLSNGYTDTATVDVTGIYNPGGAVVDVVKGDWVNGSILFRPSNGSGSSKGLELDTGDITYVGDGAMQVIAIEDSTVVGDNKNTGFSVYNPYPKATSVTMTGTPTQKNGKWVDNATLLYAVSEYTHVIRDVDVSGIFEAGMAEGSEDTTLTGGWQNGTYTVRAAPQGDEISTSPVLDISGWQEGRTTVTLKDNGASTGISDEIVIPPVVNITGTEMNTGYFSITCTIGGTTRSGTCFIDAWHSYQAGAEEVTVTKIEKSGTTRYSANYKTVYIPSKATASNGAYKEQEVSSSIEIAYNYAYGKGWEAALNTVALDPDTDVTISSAKTVTVSAFQTPDATTRSTLKSVTITPSGGSTPTPGTNVVGSVNSGESIKCDYAVRGYEYEWMPVKYGDITGYMQSRFISMANSEQYGTNWYENRINGNNNKPTRTGSDAVKGTYYNTGTVRNGTSFVNIRSSPNT